MWKYQFRFNKGDTALWCGERTKGESLTVRIRKITSTSKVWALVHVYEWEESNSNLQGAWCDVTELRQLKL